MRVKRQRPVPTSTLAWVNIWLLLLVGCGSELPMGETPGVPPTFGEEVYRIVCGRLAAEALPHDVDASESGPFCRGESGAIAAPSSAMAVLDENRDRLIDALNETVPPDLTDDLDAFFLRLLPIYDPPAEVLPTHTRALADALQQWAADPDATASLARLSAREGYAPLTARWGPLHALSLL